MVILYVRCSVMRERRFTEGTTGDPGSVIVPQYGSSKITVFVWGKNTMMYRSPERYMASRVSYLVYYYCI